MRQRHQKHQGPTLPGRLYKELGQSPTESSGRQRGSFVQASRRKQARKLSRRGVKPDRHVQTKQPVQQVCPQAPQQASMRC